MMFLSPSALQPGRLAHGPEEKQGLFGFTAGLSMVFAPF
jgi:hypothetical protein